MNTKKYVVLRLEGNFTPGPDTFSQGVKRGDLDGTDARLEVVAEDLSQSDYLERAREDRTVAISESMPMQLIQPVDVPDQLEAEDTADNVTWGVAAVGAKDSPFNGAGVTVAVLDTGIDKDHPAFRDMTLELKNFTTESDSDVSGHGTHCAGTIFGQDVDGQRIGIARNIKKALIGKVLGRYGGTTEQAVNAVMWAAQNGADVISMSMGVDFVGYMDRLKEQQGIPKQQAASMALEAYLANVRLFENLAKLVGVGGMCNKAPFIVAASGNGSRRPHYEITASLPAATSDVFSIGALKQTPAGLDVAEFSNIRVDASAPGCRVLSAVPGAGLGHKSGTSMAAPHVAGVAALWVQFFSERRESMASNRIRNALIRSCITSPLKPQLPLASVGEGIIQAPSA